MFDDGRIFALAGLLVVAGGAVVARSRGSTSRRSDKHLVFIYGTAKSSNNGPNRWRLGGARKIRDARLANHKIIDVHEYNPGLVEAPGQTVDGELYELDTDPLLALDAYEGRYWHRRPIVLQDGTKAYAYLYEGAAQ